LSFAVEIADIEGKIYTKALNFLALKPRSEQETLQRLNRYLHKFNLTTEEKSTIVDKVVSQLKEENLIDDEKYVAEFKRSIELSSKPRGTQYFKKFLAKKGIDRKLIDKTELQIDPEVEFAAAKALALKKMPSIKAKKPVEVKRKLWSFLLYRGFGGDVIGRVIDSILSVD
jgi:regulatory protein